MSLTLSLVPLVIAIGASLSSASVGILTAQTGGAVSERGGLPEVETIFQDSALLVKTLTEHGIAVDAVSDDEFIAETESGRLHYYRRAAEGPFLLKASDVSDLQELLDSLDALENEYGRNVQKFTYDKILCSLAEHGMTLESEEVLEDDSILLTLNV